MASTLTVRIPHTLPRDEAAQRIQAGIPQVVIPGGGSITAQWQGASAVTMTMKAMGQKLAIDLQVQDAAVETRVAVPLMLMAMKGAIEGFVQKSVAQMLAGAPVSPAPASQPASPPAPEAHRPALALPAQVRALHDSAIVIDAVCPLASEGQHLERCRQGGVTVVTPTLAVGPDDAVATLKKLGFWHALLASRPDLMAIRTAADVRAAKATQRLGILLAFQGGDAIEDDVDLIDAYKGLGVGIIQLTYNVQNRIGCGCEVDSDSGLTPFGREVVARMNAARVIVDCSHTGYRTTLDAIAASTAPVIFSHANPQGVHPIRRNIRDEQIQAAAATGGVIGVAGYPPFVSRHARPSLNALIDHITYVADLVGVAHVGLGLDYFTGQHGIMPLAEAQATYDFMLQAGLWSADNYGPPPYVYPQGIETLDTLAHLTAGLKQRGFADGEVTQILGGNWLRVFEAVWG
ncbi:MAG: polyhydroxyalkanoic acid system family protein [Pseudomonadota bacterium]|nr:polyhydroxyalkanoic acid system family protein [Pseudomonadota bacterium]